MQALSMASAFLERDLGEENGFTCECPVRRALMIAGINFCSPGRDEVYAMLSELSVPYHLHFAATNSSNVRLTSGPEKQCLLYMRRQTPAKAAEPTIAQDRLTLRFQV